LCFAMWELVFRDDGVAFQGDKRSSQARVT
jgi:hypothetical protein